MNAISANRFLNTLSCDVCHNAFDNNTRKPLINSSCTHTCCSSCWDDKKFKACPTCDTHNVKPIVNWHVNRQVTDFLSQDAATEEELHDNILDALTCEVCKEYFDDERKPQVNPACCHTYCSRCWAEFKVSVCPTCDKRMGKLKLNEIVMLQVQIIMPKKKILPDTVKWAEEQGTLKVRPSYQEVTLPDEIEMSFQSKINSMLPDNVDNGFNQQQHVTKTSQASQQKRPCKYYLKEMCSRGENCMYLHPRYTPMLLQPSESKQGKIEDLYIGEQRKQEEVSAKLKAEKKRLTEDTKLKEEQHTKKEQILQEQEERRQRRRQIADEEEQKRSRKLEEERQAELSKKMRQAELKAKADADAKALDLLLERRKSARLAELSMIQESKVHHVARVLARKHDVDKQRFLDGKERVSQILIEKQRQAEQGRISLILDEIRCQERN